MKNVSEFDLMDPTWRPFTALPRSVAALFARHEARNAKRTVIARTIVFVLIFAWLLGNYGHRIAVDELPTLLLFIANGWWGYWVARRRPAWRSGAYLVILIDCVLLSLTLFWPAQTYPEGWPWPTVLRQSSMFYFLIVLGLAVLTFRPLLIVWAGFCSMLSWSVAYYLILRQPGTTTDIGGDITDPNTDLAAFWLERYLDPNYVHMDDLYVRMFVMTVLTLLLALAAWRTRGLMVEQALVSRERANLARYMAPELVERLATTDSPLGAPRIVEAAILFADIKGFTRLVEDMPPEATMTLLRRFHQEMAEAVFEHGGTVDKFIGDGLMATFGAVDATALRSSDLARQATACALAMQARLRRFNGERTGDGETALAMGIGMHLGPVTVGDIGSARRLEFAVLGDTVNLASRIEGLTRSLDADILASDAIARNLDGSQARLIDLGMHRPRGREGEVRVWRVEPLRNR